MQSRRTEKAKELQDAIERLVVAGEGVVFDGKAEGETAVGDRSEAGITELRDAVAQLQKSLQEITISTNPAESNSAGTAMDAAGTRPSDPRKGKARATSVDMDISDTEMDVDEGSQDRTSDAIAPLRTLLEGVEERVANLENEHSQQIQDLNDELDSLIQERSTQLLAEAARRPLVESHPKLAQALRRVQSDIKLNGEQISEIAQEVGNLITQQGALSATNNTLTKENADLRNENSDLKREINELQQRLIEVSIRTALIHNAHASPCRRKNSTEASWTHSDRK